MVHLDPAAVTAFVRDGYHLERALFGTEEVRALRDHVLGLVGHPTFSEAGTYDPGSPDPLRRYPRLMHPHLGDERMWAFVSDERCRRLLVGLLGAQPSIVQTMVYFKPPGSRGQALHQDNRYLQVHPGTCAAVWLALEDTDVENGCLRVVPRSHTLGTLCPVPSDTSRSFTPETVPLPPGATVVDVPMRAGDALVFVGDLVHGSEPNRTVDRFRTIVVGHYATGEAQRISAAYPRARAFDGTPVTIEPHDRGMPCGTFVDGHVVVTSTVEQALAAH